MERNRGNMLIANNPYANRKYPDTEKVPGYFLLVGSWRSHVLFCGGVKFTLSDATFSPFGGNMQILYSAGMELQASANCTA